MPPASPRSSVVVPLHNGSRHLPWFWKSLCDAVDENTEVILVDDGSVEDVFAAMPGCLDHPAVAVIRHETPRGFAAAVNAGLRTAQGRFLFILNSDLILERGCLRHLRNALEADPSIGLVGATLVFPQTGGIQHAGIAFSETNHCHLYAHLPAAHPLVSVTREVQAVAFAACCFPSWVLEAVGPLNEAYFNSYEDFDYCFRVRQAGGRIIVCPDARGYHWERQSGPIRSVLRKDNVARLWRDWGHCVVPDLSRYLLESWNALLASHPVLRGTAYTLVNLARNRMAGDALSAIGAEVMRLSVDESWDLTQRDTVAVPHWLPLLLPVHAAAHPRPFVYLVDSFTDLNENRYWFALRRAVTDHELIVDLCGNVLSTSILDGHA